MPEPKRMQTPPEGQDRRSWSDRRSRQSYFAGQTFVRQHHDPKSNIDHHRDPFTFAIIFAIMGPIPPWSWPAASPSCSSLKQGAPQVRSKRATSVGLAPSKSRVRPNKPAKIQTSNQRGAWGGQSLLCCDGTI